MAGDHVHRYIPQGTQKRFYVPMTLAQDFREFLSNDIPHTVMDFELVTNWYDRFVDGYEPHYIRGEIYPDTTKSRYQNTDNNMNIRCDVDSGIKKGDIVVDDEGIVYVLDWFVAKQSNNTPSRALRCNMPLTIKRYHEEITDEDGYCVEPEGWSNIFVNMPANAYRYDGRPQYSAVSGRPGISPDSLTLLTVQFNEKTRNIKIDDRFEWGGEEYIIVDIDWVGVTFLQNFGTIKLQAKKAPGGYDGLKFD